MTRYTLTGSVRGNCGHRHTTLSGAARCACDDQAGCKSQGGYSDRRLIVLEDGEPVEMDEWTYAAWADALDRARNP